MLHIDQSQQQLRLPKTETLYKIIDISLRTTLKLLQLQFERSGQSMGFTRASKAAVKSVWSCTLFCKGVSHGDMYLISQRCGFGLLGAFDRCFQLAEQGIKLAGTLWGSRNLRLTDWRRFCSTILEKRLSLRSTRPSFITCKQILFFPHSHNISWDATLKGPYFCVHQQKDSKNTILDEMQHSRDQIFVSTYKQVLRTQNWIRHNTHGSKILYLESVVTHWLSRIHITHAFQGFACYRHLATELMSWLPIKIATLSMRLISHVQKGSFAWENALEKSGGVRESKCWSHDEVWTITR